MKIKLINKRYKTYLATIILITLIIEIFMDFGSKSYQTEMIFGAKHKILDRQCNELGQTRGFTNWFFICLSKDVFSFIGQNEVTDYESLKLDQGNKPIPINFAERIIPFAVGIAILPATYLATISITSKKSTALITTTLTAIHPVYLIFNSSQYFAQTWVLFLILSIWLLNKNIKSSMALLILSVFAKALSLLYIPAMILSLKNIKEKLIYTSIIPIIIIIGITSIQLTGSNLVTSENFFMNYFSFNIPKFDLVYEERTIEPTIFNKDQLHFIIPVVKSIYTLGFAWNFTSILIPFLLFYLYRKEQPKKIFWFLLVIIMTILLLPIFTPQFYFAHRTLPFVIFINMGMALIINNYLLEKKILKSIGLFSIAIIQYLVLIFYAWNGTNFNILIW